MRCAWCRLWGISRSGGLCFGFCFYELAACKADPVKAIKQSSLCRWQFHRTANLTHRFGKPCFENRRTAIAARQSHPANAISAVIRAKWQLTKWRHTRSSSDLLLLERGHWLHFGWGKVPQPNVLSRTWEHDAVAERNAV